MNITFMTGIMIATGAVLLHRFWPDNPRTGAATALWVLYGISYSVSGIYPADVNFWAHTVPALPGMLVQIPAMIIIGLVPGLLQRLLYGFVWLWMIGVAIALWRTDPTLKRNATGGGLSRT